MTLEEEIHTTIQRTHALLKTVYHLDDLQITSFAFDEKKGTLILRATGLDRFGIPYVGVKINQKHT